VRLLLPILLATGCELIDQPDLERMTRQRNLRPYEASELFPDGRAMRLPPLHTVPQTRILGRPQFTDGIEADRYTDAIPLPIDRALLKRGRSRFDIFCAACHGRRGDGMSEVARNMDLRKPPSLVGDEVRGFPPGRIFRVITVGYGLMPAYANDLTPQDRWATVAYLRALQLSQGIPADKLPPELRKALP
jgi:mono/diheme cytochrome c family protein